MDFLPRLVSQFAVIKSINRLKALASVLSQTRDVISDIYGIGDAEAFEKTEVFIKENSDKWRQEEPDINYEDPFCRMAYLYMNVAVHASLLEQAFVSYPEIENLLKAKVNAGSDLQICILGGGPGSELLGTVRYIQSVGLAGTAHLDLVLVDRIKEWDESWHALKVGIDNELKIIYGNDRGNWPATISRSFLPLDVTSVDDFAHFATRFASIDIFLACYLVSELKSTPQRFGQVLDLLIKRAKPGSMILFIDRDEKHVRDAADNMIAGNELLQSLGIRHARGRLEDNLTDLGEWYINLPSLPRQHWLAFFHLARRVN